MMRSLLVIALAFVVFTTARAAARSSANLVVTVYPCSGNYGALRVTLSSASGGAIAIRMHRFGDAWRGAASVDQGYYLIESKSGNCRGHRSFGLLAGATRHIALIEEKDAGTIQRAGAVQGVLPVSGARVFVERTGAPHTGSWASLDGRAFYADALAPGTYDVDLHFGNCCGITDQVKVSAGEVAVAHFSIAKYYSQAFATLTENSYLSSLAIDSGGNPWFSEALGLEARIATIDKDGHLAEYPVPGSEDVTSLTPSPDGSIWFFDYGNQEVGRLDATRRVLHYGKPSRFGTEFRLAPDGTLWAAAFDSGSVQHIDPTTGTSHAYMLAYADAGGENAEIAVQPNGVLVHTSGGLGRIATIAADGAVVDKKLDWNCEPNRPISWGDGVLVSCRNADVRAITADAQLRDIKKLDIRVDPASMRFSGTLCSGRVWFGNITEHAFDGIDLKGHHYFLPYGGENFYDLTCSGDRLWLIEHSSPTVSIAVSIDMSGETKRYDLPKTVRDSTNLPGIDSLVPDGAGNVWFLARGSMALYRLTAAGELQRIPVHPKPVKFPR